MKLAVRDGRLTSDRFARRAKPCGRLPGRSCCALLVAAPSQGRRIARLRRKTRGTNCVPACSARRHRPRPPCKRSPTRGRLDSLFDRNIAIITRRLNALGITTAGGWDRGPAPGRQGTDSYRRRAGTARTLEFRLLNVTPDGDAALRAGTPDGFEIVVDKAGGPLRRQQAGDRASGPWISSPGPAWRQANVGHISLDQLKVIGDRALPHRGARTGLKPSGLRSLRRQPALRGGSATGSLAQAGGTASQSSATRCPLAHDVPAPRPGIRT